MPKVSKAKGKKRPRRRRVTSALYKSSDLAKKYNITADAVRKKMSRHGFKADANGLYSEAEFLRAHKVGLESDKAAAAKQKEAAGDRTLQAVLLDGKTRLMDVQIQRAQVELDQIRGTVIPVEEHRDILQKVQNLMFTWWDQAADIAAAKLKNAEILKILRAARDRASEQILEVSE